MSDAEARSVEKRDELLLANMRFYGDMRFKQLTLLMAVISLAAVAVRNSGGSYVLLNGWSVRAVVAFGTALFTAVLWLMEVRSTIYWVAHREKQKDLWPRPDEGSFRTRGVSGFNATNGVLVLYVGLYAFWTFATYVWFGSIFPAALLLALGVALLGDTVDRYMPLWTHGSKAPEEPPEDAEVAQRSASRKS